MPNDCPFPHCTEEERTLIEAVLASAKAEHALYVHFAQNGDPAKSYPVTEAAAMTRVIVTDAVQAVLKMRGMELGE